MTDAGSGELKIYKKTERIQQLQATLLSDHIKQYIVLAFRTGGCLLLHESSAEIFHAAISNHLSIAISMSPEWMVP